MQGGKRRPATLLKTDPGTSVEFCVIFNNTHMAKHLWTAAKEVTNIEVQNDPVHQKDYSKRYVKRKDVPWEISL